jgi:hypothetical protein
MKKIILAAVMVASTFSFAAASKYNPEAIYGALNVKEVALNPGIVGASRLQKSVGGATCIRSLIIYPGAKPTFECSFDKKAQNFAMVYKALNVKEVQLNPGIVGVGRFSKDVGGLSCERSSTVVQHPVMTYTCKVSKK